MHETIEKICRTEFKIFLKVYNCISGDMHSTMNIEMKNLKEILEENSKNYEGLKLQFSCKYCAKRKSKDIL